MSNKPYDQLWRADKYIRQISPNKGMTTSNESPQVRITLIRGFELFNTRHYHNYETWSDGYRVEIFDSEGKVSEKVEREDLDEALIEMLAIVNRNKKGE